MKIYKYYFLNIEKPSSITVRKKEISLLIKTKIVSYEEYCQAVQP